MDDARAREMQVSNVMLNTGCYSGPLHGRARCKRGRATSRPRGTKMDYNHGSLSRRQGASSALFGYIVFAIHSRYIHSKKNVSKKPKHLII